MNKYWIDTGMGGYWAYFDTDFIDNPDNLQGQTGKDPNYVPKLKSIKVLFYLISGLFVLNLIR